MLLKGKKILYLIGCPSGDVWFENDNDVEYANILKEKIEAEVINTRFLKPIDEKVILKLSSARSSIVFDSISN